MAHSGEARTCLFLFLRPKVPRRPGNSGQGSIQPSFHLYRHRDAVTTVKENTEAANKKPASGEMLRSSSFLHWQDPWGLGTEQLRLRCLPTRCTRPTTETTTYLLSSVAGLSPAQVRLTQRGEVGCKVVTRSPRQRRPGEGHAQGQVSSGDTGLGELGCKGGKKQSLGSESMPSR